MNPTPIHPAERVVLTPKEFASLLGRNHHWVYRQISTGKVRTISKLGRKMIPRSEVDRLRLDMEINTETRSAASGPVHDLV